jgi:hypothetical protein
MHYACAGEMHSVITDNWEGILSSLEKFLNFCDPLTAIFSENNRRMEPKHELQ